jgi:orotidine-5'-phosphate decarboxylase
MAGVIVALDFADKAHALRLVDDLGESCDFYKVGSELFTAEGPLMVESLREKGCHVFLDLKLHDIPNTVSRAIRRIDEMGVRMTTVHASGGRAMVQAALDAAGVSLGVFAVTVLTSLDDTALAEVSGNGKSTVSESVVRLAALSSSCGVRGVVCSGHEVAGLRKQFGPTLELLVPGIRLAGDSADDQSRIVTPEAAVAAGADYIVIGRSVTAAGDPKAAMQAVLERITHTPT